MKKQFLALFIVIGMNSLYAKVNAVVSILPQKTFVEAIGGDKVNVSLMVTPGNSPHTYEPKPSQMKEIANANVYFTIGVEFEEAWLPKFTSQNEKMEVVHIDHSIQKIEMKEHHHEEKHAIEAHHDDHEERDPHIWTSPANVKLIAKNIYQSLIKIDPKNKAYYLENYKKLMTHIDETDIEITNLLIDLPTERTFMVFHPAWGYFARDYGLTQIAIEVSGKSPKPKQVMLLIKKAKEERVSAVFTAPEFSEKVAQEIANELHIPVIKVSPLNPKWSQNLINLAKAIAHK